MTSKGHSKVIAHAANLKIILQLFYVEEYRDLEI